MKRIFNNSRLNNIVTLALILSVFFCINSNQLNANKKIGPEHKGIKFGVMVNNEDYTIYRSAKLGKSGFKTLDGYLRKRDLPFPKTVIYMNKTGYKFPFYFALEEFHLKNRYNFTFYHSFGPNRTYLDGHNPYEADDDIDTKWNLGRHARKYFDFRNDGVDGGISTFYKILGIILEPKNQPVLFHCHGGRHRTGMIAMALRHIQGGDWIEGKHHRRMGMDLNPAEYEYYKFNHMMFRKENIEFIRQLNKDSNFIKLKKNYRNLLQEPEKKRTTDDILSDFLDDEFLY